MDQPAWLTQCETEGVVLALDDQGHAVIRGRRPSAALLQQLKQLKPAIQQWLEQNHDEPKGRWGEAPPRNLPYRKLEPDYTDEQFNALTAWALRQPAPVRNWVQARAVAYFQRSTGWCHRSYDLAAARDLIKWQLNQENPTEFPDD